MGRNDRVAVSAFVLLTACAAAPTSYDLRPAYLAALPEAQAEYLHCEGKSDLVCDCRRGGLEAEFPNPSRGSFDKGYAAYTAALDEGADPTAAETRAVHAVLAAVTAQVEDICTYHEQERR